MEDICRFLHVVIAKIAFCELDLLFEGNLKKKKISEMVRASAQMYVRHFLHLSSTCVKTKIVLHDLDLLFNDKKFEILISQKQWEPAQHVEWLLVPVVFNNILVF